MTERQRRQEECAKWVRETFGEASLTNVQTRIARFMEEAIELAQAEDFPKERLHALVEFVYDRAKGVPFQEVGGVSTTLLSYCASVGIDADDAEDIELRRVQLLDPERFRRRQAEKDAIGTGNKKPEET
jgi:hypothetical protein